MLFDPPQNPTYLADDVIAGVCADPGFGKYFTDHMAVANWTAEDGWENDRIVDYSPLTLDPAGAVYHYAQEIFEGLKAYRRADGSVWLFRPEANAARFRNSAVRLALPELPESDFVTSVRQLVALEERWVPSGEEQSLYLRPFMLASESFLGVRPSKRVLYSVIASPVGSYFSGGVAPVDIWVSKEYSRVATGGTGSAKCGGNYASSLLPQELAYAQGCSQVLFVDAAERRWIEELGGMNFFMITSDDQLVTPELNGNILPGVTRDSLLKVAPQLGLTPVERRVSLEEVVTGIGDGTVRELFACGTAAVITPIRSLKDDGHEYVIDVDRATRTLPLRNLLLDIQYGRVDDPFGWTQKVC
ncbi:branched-chain amino acid aminotransferase [Brooklawnia cerclae]